jgi:hypothetical protein
MGIGLDVAQCAKAAKNARWRHRVGHEWGLVEWVSETCRAWGVEKLLIEGKASGITAAQAYWA